MALIRPYEIPGTGLTAPDAYHVITNLKVEKRTSDIQPPPDAGHPSGYTDGGWKEGTEVYWKAGYLGHITVTIWASKKARQDGQTPIGFAGQSPTETEYEGNIGTKGLDHRCVFFVDVDSSKSPLQQAYEHLKSLDFYKEVIED